jgi:hypothetical protein
VAIAKRRASGFREPVLVLDLDLHDGDGTRSIFAGDRSVHTYSIHNRDLPTGAAVESTSIALGDDVTDGRYMEALGESLPALLRSFRPGLVYYLAGCDPAADDALGNWRISPAALLLRDRFVMERIAEILGRVPVVILLAGGYGQEAWRYSARFFSYLAGHPGLEPPRTSELTLAHYRRISGLLRVSELTAQPYGEDWQLNEGDLMPGPGAHAQSSRLLGFYSRHGIELALERYGFLERLRKKGFDGLRVDLDLDDAGGHTVRILTSGPDPVSLVELRVRRDRRLIPGMELLSVEWLMLQNPRADFGPTRPGLPGQKHPGLGMLREASALLVLVCERLELDGMVVVPSHYHIAALTFGPFRFLEAEDQARFLAVREAVSGVRLLEAAHAIEEGRLVQVDEGKPFQWIPAPMVHGVSRALERRLADDDFDVRARALGDRYRFELVAS